MVGFSQYRTEMYPAALRQIQVHLAETPIAALEDLCLRLMHLLEYGHVTIPDTPEGGLFKLLGIKACNETLGFIACCKAGSTWAAHHHARAILELYACTEHLVIKPASRQKRIARFVEYADLALYQRHLRDLADASSPEDFERNRFVSPAQVARLEQCAQEWKKLYDQRDLARVQHWHSPSTIRDLFKECDAKPLDNDESQNAFRAWWRTYEQICHLTHVSPLGHRAVGTEGLPLMGFSRDLQNLRNLIITVGVALSRAISLWDREYVPGGRLLRRTRDYIWKLKVHGVQSSEAGRQRAP